MNLKEALEFAKKFQFSALTTLNNDNHPETRAMVNLLNPEVCPHLVDYFNKNDKIYIMTNTSSAKTEHIKKNPKSSLYFVDYATFEGLLLMGDIKEIHDEKIKGDLWHDSWKVYYAEGKDGGDFSVLEFTPNKYKLYRDMAVEEKEI